MGYPILYPYQLRYLVKYLKLNDITCLLKVGIFVHHYPNTEPKLVANEYLLSHQTV